MLQNIKMIGSITSIMVIFNIFLVMILSMIHVSIKDKNNNKIMIIEKSIKFIKIITFLFVLSSVTCGFLLNNKVI